MLLKKSLNRPFPRVIEGGSMWMKDGGATGGGWHPAIELLYFK
jgi:hypothetical protein